MDKLGDKTCSEVWRYGVVVGAALAAALALALAVAEGMAAAEVSRARDEDGVFLDEGAMMAGRGHGCRRCREH